MADLRESLAVPAIDAARLCGVSRATWFRLNSAGRIPAPVRIGSVPRWRVEELRAWLEAGCPTRERWMATRGGGK